MDNKDLKKKKNPKSKNSNINEMEKNEQVPKKGEQKILQDYVRIGSES